MKSSLLTFTAMVLSFLLLSSCTEKEKEMIAPKGGYQVIPMDNGIEVKLGPDSKAIYKSSGAALSVDGEAEIRVPEGKKITVNTPNGIVNAQQSLFRLHSRRTTLIVQCKEGSVSTSNIDGGAPKDLIGGNECVYNGKNLADFSEKTVEQMTNDKYWVFNSASLRFILEALTAQYGVDFNNEGANINKVFSGFVPRDEIEIALNIVLRSSGVSYSEQGGAYVLTN